VTNTTIINTAVDAENTVLGAQNEAEASQNEDTSKWETTGGWDVAGVIKTDA
jgi:hypothetical protein